MNGIAVGGLERKWCSCFSFSSAVHGLTGSCRWGGISIVYVGTIDHGTSPTGFCLEMASLYDGTNVASYTGLIAAV